MGATFTTPQGLPVRLRPATPEDESFVFNSWLTSHRDNGDWPKRLSSGRYYGEHKVTVAKLLARARAIVACNEERPWQAFGYIVFETPALLHWIFVKHTYRHDRIAHELLAAAGLLGAPEIVCSHWTLGAEKLRARGQRWRYDPFALEAT